MLPNNNACSAESRTVDRIARKVLVSRSLLVCAFGRKCSRCGESRSTRSGARTLWLGASIALGLTLVACDAAKPESVDLASLSDVSCEYIRAMSLDPAHVYDLVHESARGPSKAEVVRYLEITVSLPYRFEGCKVLGVWESDSVSGCYVAEHETTLTGRIENATPRVVEVSRTAWVFEDRRWWNVISPASEGADPCQLWIDVK